MNTTLIAVIVFVCLFGAVLLGMRLRRLLPEHHLSDDTKDTVKLAMDLVATMAALVLGLLVSSAKGSYDTEQTQVIQIAAKLVFLDRLLANYGPETAETRAQIRAVVEEAVRRMWPEESSVPPRLAARTEAGDVVYFTIEHLAPRDDMQRDLKVQATTLAGEIGQLRSLLLAQSAPSISMPLLIVVVSWLVVIFLSFSLLAPPNATAILAMMVSALSVSGAIFLILELDRPFDGLIAISSEPLLKVLSQLAK